MTELKVVTVDRGPVVDRDARAVSIRVLRDGTDLGLFHTWVSGQFDLARNNETALTNRQFSRVVAEWLADHVVSLERERQLRTAWQLESTFVPLDEQNVLSRCRSLVRPPKDFEPDSVIVETTV